MDLPNPSSPGLGQHQQRPPRRPHGAAWTLAGFCLAIALLLAIAIFGYIETQRASSARSAVTHTLIVTGEALELENAAATMEAHHRAFLITGQSDFLEQRERSHGVASRHLAQLADRVADNPTQARRLHDVAAGLDQRYRLMRESSDRAASQGIDAARAGFHASGTGSIDPIRVALRDFRIEEDRLLAARSLVSDRGAKRLNMALLYGTAAAFAILGTTGLALRQQLRRSERTRAKLAELSGVQHAMLENAGHIVIAVRQDGTIRLFNQAASEALGYSPSEMIGVQTPAILHDPAEVQARAAVLSQELGVAIEPGFGVFMARPDRGQVDNAEWTYIRKDGTRFPVELSFSAVRGPNGEALGYVGMALDLTRRKIDEHAIRALNDELNARALDLAQTNHELESFSYSVSHDLRAPLRHIAGYARILLEDAADRLDAESVRFLETIAATARRMGLLIDDLLSLSRLGRKPVERQSVDMHSLVEDALRDVVTGAATIDVGDLPATVGDPALLKQVWLNLVSNAVKYSAPRGAASRVEIRGETHDGRNVYSVRDNGVGFDMRYADKLFGVFQRMHPQEEFEGTGVGLAIVQRIVNRHNGRISAVAEVGEGAVFTFELPYQEA